MHRCGVVGSLLEFNLVLAVASKDRLVKGTVATALYRPYFVAT